MKSGVSGQPYSLNIAMKFAFLTQIKHQVIMVHGWNLSRTKLYIQTDRARLVFLPQLCDVG